MLPMQYQIIYNKYNVCIYVLIIRDDFDKFFNAQNDQIVPVTGKLY